MNDLIDLAVMCLLIALAVAVLSPDGCQVTVDGQTHTLKLSGTSHDDKGDWEVQP